MSHRARWLEDVLETAASRRRVLVILDYDGTLVPVRARPHLATLGSGERDTLRRLNRGRARLAMMSGRSVADLRDRVDVEGILYGGVFGLSVQGPGFRYLHPRARRMQGTLTDLHRGFRKLFADVPGAHVEDKGVGVCVHYRAVPAGRRREFERRLAHARAAAPRGLRWRRGRCSWEVTPAADWDKGRAAEMLWRRHEKPYMLVVGDEHFDEPMLRAAARARGAGIRVGRGKSQAQHRLRGPREVRRFLRALADRLDLPVD